MAAPVFRVPYEDLKKALDGAEDENTVARVLGEADNQPLTAHQREALALLGRARLAEIPREQEDEGRAPEAALDVLPGKAELAPREPQTERVPPKNPQEALANIKNAELGAKRTQLGRGLLDENGRAVQLNDAQMLVALGMCVTYDLNPAAGEIMLMGNEPYAEVKGCIKIVKKNSLFRAWLEAKYPIDDFEKKRFLCRGGARFKDPDAPDDPSRDQYVIADGYADEGNVTKLIADPKGKGGAGFIRDMAHNRMLRKVQELSTPIAIDWERLGLKVEEARAERRAAEPAVRDVPVEVAPAADKPSDTEAATEAQVKKIRDLAKSSKVEGLKKKYQTEHGLDPADWSKETAGKFIDEALAKLNEKGAA